MKFVHADVLEAPLNVIKTNAIRQLLISGYTAGDSYATVVAAKIAEATMASGDYTLATATNDRTLTTASGKTATSTAASAALVSAGTASSGSTTTLVDTGAGWTVNAYAGKALKITSGTGVDQQVIITSNTADTLTFPALATAPDATSVFRITNNHHIAFTNNVDKVYWVTDETGNDPVASGDTVNYPVLVYTEVQPV